jgi:hypothetical protein
MFFADATTGNVSMSGSVAIGGDVNISGNVGIGTTTPTAKLEVAGTMKSLGLTTGGASLGLVSLRGIVGGVNPSLSVPGLSVGNPMSSALRLTNAGNLVNIGSYQGGSMSLTKGGTFKLPSSIASITGPKSISSADFNGDGLMDVVTANTDNTVSIILNTYSPPSTQAVSPDDFSRRDGNKYGFYGVCHGDPGTWGN